ncbi:MAG: competence type IV pilus major pilin ComGC [Armatimonadota bacterium]
MLKCKLVMKNSIGFTLIEIMVTIFIIGILLSIAVPAWVFTRQRSQIRTCMAQLSKIEYAKELWAMENPVNVADPPDMNDLYPVFLKTQPACPAGGSYEINDTATPPSCTLGGEHKIH